MSFLCRLPSPDSLFTYFFSSLRSQSLTLPMSSLPFGKDKLPQFPFQKLQVYWYCPPILPWNTKNLPTGHFLGQEIDLIHSGFLQDRQKPSSLSTCDVFCFLLFSPWHSFMLALSWILGVINYQFMSNLKFINLVVLGFFTASLRSSWSGRIKEKQKISTQWTVEIMNSFTIILWLLIGQKIINQKVDSPFPNHALLSDSLPEQSDTPPSFLPWEETVVYRRRDESCLN